MKLTDGDKEYLKKCGYLEKDLSKGTNFDTK